VRGRSKRLFLCPKRDRAKVTLEVDKLVLMTSFDDEARWVVATQALDTVSGRWLMVLFAVMTALALSLVFRPRPQSPFSSAGGFGRGHGSESIMFGANSRAGAPRLR
jgi:hypothetical protein